MSKSTFKAEIEFTNLSFAKDFDLVLGQAEDGQKYSFQRASDRYFLRFEFEARMIPDFEGANAVFAPIADLLVYFVKGRLDYRYAITYSGSGTIYLVRPEAHRDYLQKTEFYDDIIEKTGFILRRLYSRRTVMADEYREYYLLTSALKWYRKSWEGDRADRFVFLWIVFNMLYNHVWFNDHSNLDKQGEADRIRYLIASDDGRSGIISGEECRSLLEEKYWIARAMPDYGMYAPRSEIKENPTKEEVERWHQKYVEITENIDRFLFNQKGLEFGKYFVLKDWKNALREGLLAIYGDRCLVFHEGHFPENTYSWDNPHEARVHLLDSVVHLALDKFLMPEY